MSRNRWWLNRLERRACTPRSRPTTSASRELIDQLRDQGHLGLILVDASELAQVEHDYGSKAFHQVLSMVSGLVGELQGKEIRTADMLALNDRGGNAFLLFLSPKRSEQDRTPRFADLEAIGQRVSEQLNRRLVRPDARPTCAASARSPLATRSSSTTR